MIASGRAILRGALRAFFMNAAGIQVVGEAEDGDDAFHLTCRAIPDVVLLEFPLAYESTMSFLYRIRSETLPLHIVMLANCFDQPGVVKTIELGAKGVILKDSATTRTLCEAIRWVAAGGYWVGQKNVATLRQALQVLGGCSEDGARLRRFGLTARESEILPMLTLEAIPTKKSRQPFRSASTPSSTTVCTFMTSSGPRIAWNWRCSPFIISWWIDPFPCMIVE